MDRWVAAIVGHPARSRNRVHFGGESVSIDLPPHPQNFRSSVTRMSRPLLAGRLFVPITSTRATRTCSLDTHAAAVALESFLTRGTNSEASRSSPAISAIRISHADDFG